MYYGFTYSYVMHNYCWHLFDSFDPFAASELVLKLQAGFVALCRSCACKPLLALSRQIDAKAGEGYIIIVIVIIIDVYIYIYRKRTRHNGSFPIYTPSPGQ